MAFNWLCSPEDEIDQYEQYGKEGNKVKARRSGCSEENLPSGFYCPDSGDTGSTLTAGTVIQVVLKDLKAAPFQNN
jgi:hypothetical protein